MRCTLWRSLLIVLFVAQCVLSQQNPLLLNNYKISLFSEDRILSTVIWLTPPYCMYESWMLQTLDKSISPRSSSLIEVQVQIAENNETYVVADKFAVPQCRTIFGEPSPTNPYVFQVGPDISNQKGDKVIRILPGTTYTVRYVLYNAAKQIAYTDWSQPFKTRALIPNPREMKITFVGRSGGMVVITVLLSISMFLLLVGLAITFGTHK